MAKSYGLTNTKRNVAEHLAQQNPSFLITDDAVTIYIMRAVAEKMARDLGVTVIDGAR
jgi:hypothetical protein